MKRIVAGLEKKNRLLNPNEREIVAYHEMGHPLVALALPGSDPVHKVSIIPRGIGALGYPLQHPTKDRYLMTQEELENKMTVLLGHVVYQAEHPTFLKVPGAMPGAREYSEDGEQDRPCGARHRAGRIHRAAAILKEQRTTIERGAHELLAHETLTEGDLRELLRPGPVAATASA